MANLSPAAAATALTREVPNYVERIAHEIGFPVSELWALVLAVSGRMSYPTSELNDSESVKLGVPDVSLRPGLTRLEIWETALTMVLEALGDPEARYRTGFDCDELRSALNAFFESSHKLEIAEPSTPPEPL